MIILFVPFTIPVFLIIGVGLLDIEGSLKLSLISYIRPFHIINKQEMRTLCLIKDKIVDQESTDKIQGKEPL